MTNLEIYPNLSEAAHVNKIIFSKNIMAVKNLVEGLVPHDGITAISGHPGSGKTWFYLFLAVSVASGKPFLGKFKTSKGKVLIIDEESGLYEVKRRVMMTHDLKDKGVFYLASQGIKLEDDDCLEHIKNQIRRHNIKLVILDPFVSFHNKSENDARDMQSIMERIAQLNRVGASVIFVHHHRKDGLVSKSSQSLRGSSAFSGRVDSHISIEKVSDENDIKLIVRHEKMRGGKRLEPINVIIHEADSEMHIKYDGEKEPEKTKKELAKEKILEILEEGLELSFDDLFSEINKSLKIGERNVLDSIKELEGEKTINSRKDLRKKIYFIEKKEDIVGWGN